MDYAINFVNYTFSSPFVVGFLSAWFSSLALFTYRQRKVDLEKEDAYLTILEELTESRVAVITKDENSKYVIHDKESGTYIGVFHSWKILPLQLTDFKNVTWHVEHAFEELEKLREEEDE